MQKSITFLALQVLQSKFLPFHEDFIASILCLKFCSKKKKSVAILHYQEAKYKPCSKAFKVLCNLTAP